MTVEIISYLTNVNILVHQKIVKYKNSCSNTRVCKDFIENQKALNLHPMITSRQCLNVLSALLC